jgi:formylglycine-generating enzyme required for sulfatase activity/tRNA A-37 threonylcarbamoyl transferase component Bud32
MPPSPAADRNLLFGILALQMDFVSRDALIAAMHAWVLDKAKPLGQILVEQGALRPENHELLEALVRRHLEMHGNDPERSLAALSSLHSVRQDLEQVADADVQASLAHVSAVRPAPDPNATRADLSSPAARRFQVLRPHAKGGLGEVFVARDEELRREVALKEIQERHADNPESRARFLLEAEVTGSLEHPGIVPVYGLGSYGDGRPFYAMRFVRGDNLKDAIERFHRDKSTLPAGERTLRLRQLLGRLVDVCQAVAYAHSRGVLHRDLKPGNVMLGKYGETLVVDWGLAKVLGQADVEVSEGLLVGSADSALTQAGRALGTPAYMSPEQASGRLDQLGPRSDVYSLGATLYCLLTGQAPFPSGDAGEVLGKVQRGDYPRPRALDRGTHPALEAVCCKAMALRPEDRYASPQVLADDLEKYLADEPVTAYREPLPARLARWRRRHATLVTATALVLLTLAGAAVVGGLVVGREQAKTLHEQEARLEQQRKAREAQVGTLLDVAPQAVPAVLAALEPHRDEIRPLLQQATAQPEPQQVTAEATRLWRQHRARAALALLAEDTGQVEPLTARLQEEGLDPAEMLLVRDALRSHAAELKDDLWRRAGEGSPASRFRALVALAAYDPGAARWEQASSGAVGEMLSANPLHLGQWVEALRPVRHHLLAPLGRVYRGQEPGLIEYRQVAANVLGDYAADRPDELVALLADGDERQYAVLLPKVQAHHERAVARLTAELDLALAPDWHDAPLDPGWVAPEPALVGQVEAAQGLVAERFALCQVLPLAQFDAMAAGLRRCGYRPVRLRPFFSPSPPARGESRGEGGVVRVAAVWARDGRDAHAAHGLTAAEVRKQDAERRAAGFIPADVAGYLDGGRERYAALWVQGGKDEYARLYVGVPEKRHKADGWGPLREAKLSPVTFQVLTGTDGEERYSSVWRKTGPRASFRLGDDEGTHRERGLWDGLPVDVSLYRAERLVLEAAELEVAASGGCQHWVQDMKPYGVGLWSNDRQRFCLARQGGFVEFAVGCSRAGRYRLAAFFTRAPDYGTVQVALDGTPVGQRFDGFNDAVKRSDRVPFGTFALSAGSHRLCFTAVGKTPRSRDYYMGIDCIEFRPDRPGAGLFPSSATALVPHPERHYAGCFLGCGAFDPAAALGLTPEGQLRRCRELAGQGYRPVALSVAQMSAGGPLVTASVWHRPAVTEEVKEQLAKRQASAAVALLRLGAAERVWPLLRHRTDPRRRSYLIHRLSPLGANARSLVKRLAEEPEVSAKRALLLCLGEFLPEQLPQAERDALIPTLLKLYRDDPDSGVHGAAEWLLRQWRQAVKLREIDRQLATGKVEGPRRWYVNGQGQTLVLIEGTEFLMGSPRTEASREGGAEGKIEAQHRRRIGRTFALAAKAVTVEQFQKFRQDHQYNKQYSPTPEHPVNAVTWYDAAAYCNWLSKEEGIPEDQWCYLPNKEREFAPGMRLRPNYLSLTGYRLPTEAEWELACRAGALTSRYYGETDELLGKYAWYTKYSQDKGMLVPGGLKPNDLGLFDMLGNAWQWCEDGIFDYPRGSGGGPAAGKEDTMDLDDIKGIQDRLNRVVRGGAFNYLPVHVRSAYRNGFAPAFRCLLVGVRPARTYP